MLPTAATILCVIIWNEGAGFQARFTVMSAQKIRILLFLGIFLIIIAAWRLKSLNSWVSADVHC
jgi:hypothetical protein